MGKFWCINACQTHNAPIRKLDGITVKTAGHTKRFGQILSCDLRANEQGKTEDKRLPDENPSFHNRT